MVRGSWPLAALIADCTSWAAPSMLRSRSNCSVTCVRPRMLVETLLTETKENAEGLLRVTTTVAFGSVWLTSRLKEFTRAYPGIEIMLRLDDRELDLAMRE